MSADGPRLFLMLPPFADAGLAPALEAALGAADVACVLARFAAGDTPLAAARTLAAVAQARGTAFLVADALELAVAAAADGVQAAGTAAGLEAAKRLKPDFIVGVGGLRDRDAAMTVGEADIDYVMFGEPEAGVGTVALLDRVAWWAEIFTVPCVAFAATLAEVGPLARAGADFVALAGAVWSDPRGPVRALADAQQALALREPTA